MFIIGQLKGQSTRHAGVSGQNASYARAVTSRFAEFTASRSSDFVNHSYDYKPNWTPLAPITIMNQQ